MPISLAPHNGAGNIFVFGLTGNVSIPMAFKDDDVQAVDLGPAPFASAGEDGDEDNEPIPAVPESEEDYE